MIICDGFGHLYTTDDIAALHRFALSKLSLKESWNHCSRWFPHWDLTTAGKRGTAWRLGAHHPKSHQENSDLIGVAEAYAKTLGEALTKNLYASRGLHGQGILRVNYTALFAALPGTVQ